MAQNPASKETIKKLYKKIWEAYISRGGYKKWQLTMVYNGRYYSANRKCFC